MRTIEVRVPATTANLGPGFDCLGLALDLWNITRVTFRTEGIKVRVRGEGEGRLPLDDRNLVVRAFKHWLESRGASLPAGICFESQNSIPLSSGLGSSAAAALTGLLAASKYLGEDQDDNAILSHAARLEGHADNAAAALLGGLIIVNSGEDEVHMLPVPAAAFEVVVVLPDVSLSTHEARAALPEQVALRDAVFNIGRSSLVVEGFRRGEIDLLRKGMRDRLHQPHRLKMIPGAQLAIENAFSVGAAAALSGAGPGVIAFTAGNSEEVIERMQQAFRQAGVTSRAWTLTTIGQGASVQVHG